MRKAKRFLALLLSMTMLLSLTSIPAMAGVVTEGTNEKKIYLSFQTVTADEAETEIQSVKAGESFYAYLNFYGNPTDEVTNSIQSVNLYVQYNNSNLSITDIYDATLNETTCNPNYAKNVLFISWASIKGITVTEGKKSVLTDHGAFACMEFKALVDMNEAELKSAFTILAADADGNPAGLEDGNKQLFTIVQTPALTASVKTDAKFYDTTTLEQLKAGLAVQRIDEAGKAEDVTDFTVSVTDWKTGENTVTVTAGDLSTTVTVEAVADTVESIAVTKQPNKRVYTSGELLDLTGMEITATYESGATEVVTTGYTTDVEAGTVMTVKEYGPSKIITVTYKDKTAQTQVLTVKPRLVTIPTVQGTYTYNGSEQEFVLNHVENWQEYYTLSGDLKGKEAKNYTAYATLIDGVETRWMDGSKDVQTLTWTIAPNDNPLTLVPAFEGTITYDGSAKTPAYTVKSGEKILTAGTDYELSYSNNTNAGTATVTAKGLGNYVGATGSAEFTIAKAAIAPTLTMNGWAYGATASEPAVTGNTGNGAVTYTYYSNEACTTEIAKPTDAGTYWVKAAVAATANYEGATTSAVEFTIAKAAAPTGLAGAVSLYHADKTAGTFAVNSLTGAPANGWTDVKFTAVAGKTDAANILSAVSVKDGALAYTPTGAAGAGKTATVTATVSSKNYLDATATVTFKTVDISIDWDGIQKTLKANPVYGDRNSDILTDFNTRYTAKTTVDVPGTLSVKDADSYPAVGTKTVTLVFTPDANTGISGSFEYRYDITPVVAKPITVTAKHVSVVYGEAIPALDFDVPTGALVNGDTKEGLGLVLTTDATVGSNVGSYDITRASQTTKNYAITVSGTKQLTITAKPLTPAMAAEDIAAVTYTGLAQTPAVTVTDGDKTLVSGTDYTVTYSGNTNAGTAKVTILGAGNYSGSVEKSFPIEKATLTIKSAAFADKTYDSGKAATVTGVAFDGLQNGETLTLGTDFTATGTFRQEDVGENVAADVTVTLGSTDKANNYRLAAATLENAGSANITPVQTTLSLTAKDAVYTGSAYDAETKLTASANVENPDITYTYYADSNGAKGDALSTAPVNAGTYWVEGYIAASGNNSAVTSAAVKFQITKAPLTATAEDQSVTYGEEAPNYTVLYTGFVGKDNATVVSGIETDCAYAAGSDAGEYAITPKGATADNYAITFVAGKLTVGKLTAALAWNDYAERTYDGKASNVTASVTNKIGTDDVTVTVTGGDAVNAGTYTATVAGLAGAKAKNYQLPETGRSKGYSITKAARTLSGLADLTLAGDTLSAALQPQVNDLDQSARFTYASNNTAAVTVNAQGVVSAVANGTATVTVTVPATANYEAAETSVTVKAVTQAITAVSAAPDTVSAALQGKTIVLSGYAESITVTPTYYDGVRLKSGSLTVKAGETAGIVLTVGGRDIPWTIDASAVVVKPANVTVATDDEVAKAPDADETITDEVLNAIAGENTTASGLDQAAAGLIPEAAKNAPEGTAAVELTFVTQILPESYQNGVLVLEIRPVAQYKYLDQQGNAIKTEEKAIANSDIQGLVTLSVQLPAGMPVADLYARHELGGGQYEYLPVTVENGAATWQQSSFSRVSLIADARSAAVTFRMPDGSKQTVTYTPENIGQALPAASRAGYRFDGWKFPGIDGTYKTLTDELLTALNGKILTAEAQFTVMGGGGGGGGGFVSAGYAVSIAKTENGTVTASAETAEEGETITLTVKAETGYVLKTLTAAAEGKDLTLTAGKNGTYTFTMPAADVTVTAVFEKIAFADVKSGSYCYDAVQWAVAKGITLGMSDGSFAPNAPCTRGQIVTFLWRAMGCPAPKSTVNPFTDVKSGSYCYEAVLWAVEQGITKGTTATTFSPNAACTRGQAVTFLCRAVGTEGTGDTGFADVGANSFCAGSVKWAVENGVTKGTTATTFSPNETCTRGQIVTFLYRALEK